MIIILSIIGILILIFYLGINSLVFGALPKGERLKRIKNSINYRNGNFQNQSPTLAILKEASFAKMLKEYLNKPPEVTPKVEIPFKKTDLKILWNENPTIVWFGHSSYLIKSSSITLLVDPVFSGNASPFSFMINAFKGSNEYQVGDLPIIDAVLITHDHYDHLDYETISKLKGLDLMYYVSLGVGAHLTHWGVSSEKIIEFDWFETQSIAEKVTITALPARHFSGRLLKRAQSLWSSFYLNIDGYKLYLGGDSGYDSHFSTIGTDYGPFDLAILEAGQFGKYWPFIHMFPEQTVQAAIDLKAKVLLPIHWAKFALAMHNWNDPIRKVVEIAKEKNIKITTPHIGEPVVVGTNYPNEEWWNI